LTKGRLFLTWASRLLSGRIGGLTTPLVIGYTFARIGFGGVFTITTIVLAIGALAVPLLGISTASKSLEQIAGEQGEAGPRRGGAAGALPRST
jgi:putative MFS transporter